MTLKEPNIINIAACQNYVTHSLNEGGISSQWGKDVLSVKVDCIPAEGQALCQALRMQWPGKKKS